MLENSPWFLCRCGFNFLAVTAWVIDGRPLCGNCAMKIRKAKAIIDQIVPNLDAEYEDSSDEDGTHCINRLLTSSAITWLREKHQDLSDAQVDQIVTIFENEISISWERWSEYDGPREAPEFDFSEETVTNQIANLL